MTDKGIGYLLELQSIVEQRKAADVDTSYTAKLFSAGTSRMAQKVGEEAVEVAIAAVQQDKDRLRSESADLIFHLLVLLRSQDLSLQDVVGELANRRR